MCVPSLTRAIDKMAELLRWKLRFTQGFTNQSFGHFLMLLGENFASKYYLFCVQRTLFEGINGLPSYPCFCAELVGVAVKSISIACIVTVKV